MNINNRKLKHDIAYQKILNHRFTIALTSSIVICGLLVKINNNIGEKPLLRKSQRTEGVERRSDSGTGEEERAQRANWIYVYDRVANSRTRYQ